MIVLKGMFVLLLPLSVGYSKESSLVDPPKSTKKQLTTEENTKALKGALGVSSKPMDTNKEPRSKEKESVDQKNSDQSVSQPAVESDFVSSFSGSGKNKNTKKLLQQTSEQDAKLEDGIFEKSNIRTSKKKVQTKTPPSSARANANPPSSSIPFSPSPSSSPTLTRSLAIQRPAPPVPISVPSVLPSVFSSPSSIPASSSRVETTQQPQNEASSRASPTNQIPNSAKDQSCLQACIDYTSALGKDFAVRSIKRSGSTFTLEASSGIWVPRNQGRRIASTDKGDIFDDKCDHIKKGDIDQSNNKLFHVTFNNNFPAAECMAKFASILRDSFPGDSDPEADRLLEQQLNSMRPGQVNRTLPTFNNQATHSRASQACDKACGDLANAYKNGTLFVAGIAFLEDKNFFSIKTKDAFSWAENSTDTNPNFEAHETFMKECSSVMSAKIDSSNTKNLNISFKKTTACHKKFKEVASSSSARTTAAASADPFVSPVGSSTGRASGAATGDRPHPK